MHRFAIVRRQQHGGPWITLTRSLDGQVVVCPLERVADGDDRGDEPLLAIPSDVRFVDQTAAALAREGHWRMALARMTLSRADELSLLGRLVPARWSAVRAAVAAARKLAR